MAKSARRVTVQSVPTSVAVGPDGALYAGELTGFPFNPGDARVWRVVPGHAPTVYARGFTNISAIAFDRSGEVIVPGALVPVHASLEHDHAVYVEPNLWVHHRV